MALLESIDTEFKSAKGEAARKALEQLRTTLNKEVTLEGQSVMPGYQLNAANAVQQVDLQVQSVNVSNQLQQALSPSPNAQPVQQARRVEYRAIDTKALPATVRKLLAKHQETQRQAEEALLKNFNINQWRVTKE